ncbi:MAG: component of SufBCD complex [Paracoccaceae bacterium]
MPITQIIDFSGIWSFWYWVLVAVAWSMTSHFVLGVPYDFVIRAERQGGQVAEDCDTLVHIHVGRVLYHVERGGPWIVGAAAFVLACLATLGFVLKVEIAVALFMLVGPLAIVAGFTLRLARRIRAENMRGERLRRVIARRRFWNQFAGLVSILITVGIGMIWFYTANTF